MPTKLMLVEDERAIGESLTVSLEAEGYDVTWVMDGAEALTACQRTGPDLVLLDLMLPGLHGTEVCRRLRRDSSIPIIMLTARDSELDRVLGLELGADDYVTKPFSTRELIARIRAVLRRSTDVDPPLAVAEASDVRVDHARHEVHVDGRLVHVPPKEFELLALLITHAGRVLTRERLIDEIWGPNYVGDTKTLDVHIRRLRTRIERKPESPTRIETVRGIGYRLNDHPQAHN